MNLNREMYFLKKVVFEGKEYSQTKNTPKVFTNIYGDYMTLPKEDERLWRVKLIYKIQGRDEN